MKRLILAAAFRDQPKSGAVMRVPSMPLKTSCACCGQRSVVNGRCTNPDCDSFRAGEAFADCLKLVLVSALIWGLPFVAYLLGA